MGNIFLIVWNIHNLGFTFSNVVCTSYFVFTLGDSEVDRSKRLTIVKSMHFVRGVEGQCKALRQWRAHKGLFRIQAVTMARHFWLDCKSSITPKWVNYPRTFIMKTNAMNKFQTPLDCDLTRWREYFV